MNVDAVEDKATTIKRASINDREPEQICWLRPTAFKILETFRMSDPSRKASNTTINTDKIKRKVAARISELMDDKLIKTDTFNLFWTRDKRMMEIEGYDSSLSYRMKNLKIGQKDHKMYGKTDKTGFKIKIKSERGEFNITILSEDDIDSELKRFVNQWDKNKDINTGEKYTYEDHKNKEKADRERWADEENKKQKQQIIDRWGGFVSRFNSVAEKFDLPKIDKQLNEDSIADTYKLCTTKSPKLIDYFTNADLEIFNTYMKMIDIMEKNKLRPFRIPEHNLSDLMNIKV
jgi:transcriptional regulator with PAS, ATPase and Fis domain